jgi:hypothetical protein
MNGIHQGGNMGTTNSNPAIRRARPILTTSNRKHRSVRSDDALPQQDQVESVARAFRTLAMVYASIAQVLRQRLDRSGADIGEIAALGRKYEWISDRRRKVRMVLAAKPVLLAYVRADCSEPERTATLAASAVDLVRVSNDLPTALALLEYVDYELGWASPARAA